MAGNLTVRAAQVIAVIRVVSTKSRKLASDLQRLKTFVQVVQYTEN